MNFRPRGGTKGRGISEHRSTVPSKILIRMRHWHLRRHLSYVRVRRHSRQRSIVVSVQDK